MSENRFKKGIENIKQPETEKYTQDTQHTYVSHHTQQSNKPKSFNTRGKREERYGLLLDKKLKDDIKKLANAEGSRSINDFIVNILASYVDAPENQEILKIYEIIHSLKNK